MDTVNFNGMWNTKDQKKERESCFVVIMDDGSVHFVEADLGVGASVFKSASLLVSLPILPR